MMTANTEYKEYTYKTELNEADLMMLGCMLEETTAYRNAISFANAVFGVFNERSEKAKQQLIDYINKNYKPTLNCLGSVKYDWVDTNEWAYL